MADLASNLIVVDLANATLDSDIQPLYIHHCLDIVSETQAKITIYIATPSLILIQNLVDYILQVGGKFRANPCFG